LGVGVPEISAPTLPNRTTPLPNSPPQGERKQTEFAARALPDGKAGATADHPCEPAVNLPAMPLGEEVVNDYRFLELSLRTHPASFLRADLVDEAALFRSPKHVGAEGIDALEGLPLDALTRSPQLERIGAEAAGADAIEFFVRR